MTTLLKHGFAGISGLVVGVLLVLVAVYFFPFAHVGRTAPVLAAFGADRDVEVFALDGDVDGGGHPIAITHGGKGPFPPDPPSVGLMAEPAIRDGLALTTMLRDASGETVGVATELESGHEGSNLLSGRIMTHTTWTAVVPGRGALWLYQVEDNWHLATRIVGPALLRGRDWIGRWQNVNTLGPGADGHGRIVAATGRFADRAGDFIEVAEMRHFTARGKMNFTMELRLAFERGSAGGGQ